MNPNGSPRPAAGAAIGGGGGAATPGTGGGGAGPAIQATIVARRGSPAGSGAPPACICPEALVRRRLDSGARGSTSARTTASSLATSPESRNRVIPAEPPGRWQTAQMLIKTGCTAVANVGPPGAATDGAGAGAP